MEIGSSLSQQNPIPEGTLRLEDREQLARMQNELMELRLQLKQLHAELFDVPELPPIRFLDNPLGNRLEAAHRELKSFVGDDNVSDDEHTYLLMQMLFRGPMHDIRTQLLMVLESIKIHSSLRQMPVLDIGCGRGELLQLFRDKGLHALGIDTSGLMVQKLVAGGLAAIQGDGVSIISSYADNSLCGVSAFHLIEHVDPTYLKRLLSLVYRKLAPGGFLLLETPNPFSPEALSFFYTDDTHLRPLQPFQLAFLVENAGFVDCRAHFTAPVPAGRKQSIDNWLRLYQNHGLIAYKSDTQDGGL
jgi:SAM-dependent methyltransferase